MKDYNLFTDLENKNEVKKTYILRYEVKDKNCDKARIIIYLASGEKHVVPYNIENEQRILKRMKQQVLAYKEVIDKLRLAYKESNDYKMVKSLEKFFVGMLSAGILSSFVKTDSASIMSCIFSIMGGLGSLATVPFVTKYEGLIKDFDKNMLFLQNEDKINEMVMKDENVLLNLNDKITEKRVVKADEDFCFTINSIDKMSLSELKKMIDVIKREEMLFNNSNEEEQMLRRR